MICPNILINFKITRSIHKNLLFSKILIILISNREERKPELEYHFVFFCNVDNNELYSL